MANVRNVSLAAAAFAATATSLAAALLAASATNAGAADILEPVYSHPPEIVAAPVGGWYLRGDIGMTNQRLNGGLDNVLFNNVQTLEFLDRGTFTAAPSFRAGIGYQVSHWLRADATVQYRGKADFMALDRYEGVNDGNPFTWDGTNDYRARKSEWLVMANAYVDLGTFAGITPYVGAGLGASRNTISSFRDINVPNLGVAYADSNSQWNLAWALHAGVAMDVSDRLTMDLGYSYMHLGDASSGDITTYTGVNNVNNPMHFNNIVSHDFTLGLRYKLH